MQDLDWVDTYEMGRLSGGNEGSDATSISSYLEHNGGSSSRLQRYVHAIVNLKWADMKSAFLLDGVKPTIQAMLDATYAEFEAASSARWGRCQTIRTISSAKMCHSIHLGMVTRFMFKTLLPVAGNQKPDALSVSMSLKQMEEAFDDIRVDEFRNTDICIGEFSHKSCYTDWFRVRDLLSSFNNMRAPMIHDHFEARFF